MFSIHKLKDTNTVPESIITIGNYDGLHLGHQMIIENMIACSKVNNLPVIIITFDPHTNDIIYNIDTGLLMSLPQKIAKMETFNIDYLCIVDFDKKVAHMHVDDFMEIIINKYNPKYIFFGYDNKFGHKRLGSYEYFKNNDKFKNIIPIECSQYLYKDKDVKSSVIKNLIKNGNMTDVNKLLGYKYNLIGKIVKGDQIGSKIGYPTANLTIYDNKQLIPDNGVYSVNLIVESKIYNGICNIGVRPTINESSDVRVEIHILNVADISLYGIKVNLEFNYKLRDEIKFNSIEELKEQIKNDIMSLN